MVTEKSGALSLGTAWRLCELILLWHKTKGDSLPTEQGSPDTESYISILRDLVDSQPGTLDVMRRIASLQRSGSLEFAYAERIPDLGEDLNLALRQLQVDAPATLGGAAQLVIDLLDQASRNIIEKQEEYDLPTNWVSEPSELKSGRVTLHVRGDGTAREALRSHFKELARYETQGLGGREVIVDMNDDEAAEELSGQGEVIAYTPGSFGFSLSTGPDTLPTLLLRGAVAVTVTLGENAQAHASPSIDGAGSAGENE